MSPYFFSLQFIIAAATPNEAPIEVWLARRTLCAELASEENQ